MEMHQIRYFLAVADQLNFTKAAEKCNVSQPSLTRAIKLLEEELGGLLFHRERANTHLSELGTMVKPHLQQIYDESHQAKRLARDFACLKKSTLKLGIMCTIAPDQIIDLIGSIQRHHPGVELQLSDANAWDLQERLIEGALEVAIYCIPGQEPDPGLHAQALRQSSGGRRHPDHRAGILARGPSGDRAGSPAFPCGRRAGPRSDAGPMVRRAGHRLASA